MIDKIIEYLEREVSIRKIVLYADEHGSCKSYIEFTNEMREMITYLKSLKPSVDALDKIKELAKEEGFKAGGYRARRERDMKDYKGSK